MALPSSFGTDDGTIRTTGIVLSIVPLDATFGAEIQRSSDLGGGAPASSAARRTPSLRDSQPPAGILIAALKCPSRVGWSSLS